MRHETATETSTSSSETCHSEKCENKPMNTSAKRKPTPLTEEVAALPQGTSVDVTTPYEPTPEERRAIAALRGTKKTPRVTLKQKNQIYFKHPDQLHAAAVLMERLATTDEYLFGGVLTQLSAVAVRGGKVDEVRFNFMMSAVMGIGPKDELETLLATQMAAIHALALDYASQLNNSRTIPEQDYAERTLNKLMRTFAAQMETLKRYRTGGEQKVTVQHVTVADGGQAIVGNVAQGGQGATKEQETTP